MLRADDPDDLIWRIVRDGITTHGHPRALVGALVYAFALRLAASSRFTHGFGDSVEAAAVGLIDVDRVLPVLRLPPKNGLLSAAFLRKADTDTLASLTAAILGALHGTHWLGNLAVDVQDGDYIIGLAERNAAHLTDPPPRPTRRPNTLRRALRDTLLSRRDIHGEFPDGRHYHLEDVAVLPDSHVLRARLRLHDGQTAIVDVRVDPAVGPSQDHREQLPGRRPEPAHEQPDDDRALLTGRDIPVRAGTTEIAPGLRLHQSTSDTLIDPSSVIVHITVESLPAAARRLGLAATTFDDDTTTVDVRDPDGRTVRITQRSANSSQDY